MGAGTAVHVETLHSGAGLLSKQRHQQRLSGHIQMLSGIKVAGSLQTSEFFTELGGLAQSHVAQQGQNGIGQRTPLLPAP